MKALTLADIKRATRRRKYADGRGLFLSVSANGRKTWAFCYVSPLTGKSREMGLGSLDNMDVEVARKRREDLREQVRNGVDPLGERKEEMLKLRSIGQAGSGGHRGLKEMGPKTVRCKITTTFLFLASVFAPSASLSQDLPAAAPNSEFGVIGQMVGKRWLRIQRVIGQDVRAVVTYSRATSDSILVEGHAENGDVTVGTYRIVGPKTLDSFVTRGGVVVGDKLPFAILPDGSIQASDATSRLTMRMATAGVLERVWEFRSDPSQPWRETRRDQMVTISNNDAERILAVPQVGDRAEVYALCTVRDIAFDGYHFTGRLYRSKIFSAPKTYDDKISLVERAGGRVSSLFEDWIFRATGFIVGKVYDPSGSEHWCVEAPLTPAGKAELERVRKSHDPAQHPGMLEIPTAWSPPGV